MNRDLAAVSIAKTVRTFSYGFLGIVVPLHLSDLGLGPAGIGAAVTLMLVGSAVLTWAVRRPAERYGARATLVGLAGLQRWPRSSCSSRATPGSWCWRRCSGTSLWAPARRGRSSP